jgi:cell wall-associated NlpC family hydrolase
MMTMREQIVEEARKYLGVRFRHQGRTVAGIDCAGLILNVGNDLGLIEYSETGYARRPNSYAMLNSLNKNLQPVLGEPQAGDIILFSYFGRPQHLGFRTDRGMIHAFANARKVVEHHLDSTWRERIVNVYKFAGVKD